MMKSSMVILAVIMFSSCIGPPPALYTFAEGEEQLVRSLRQVATFPEAFDRQKVIFNNVYFSFFLRENGDYLLVVQQDGFSSIATHSNLKIIISNYYASDIIPFGDRFSHARLYCSIERQRRTGDYIARIYRAKIFMHGTVYSIPH